MSSITTDLKDQNDNDNSELTELQKQEKEWLADCSQQPSYPQACEFKVPVADKGILMRYINMRQPAHVFADLIAFTHAQLQQMGKWYQGQYNSALLRGNVKSDQLAPEIIVDWRAKFLQDAQQGLELSKEKKRSFRQLGQVHHRYMVDGDEKEYISGLGEINHSLANELSGEFGFYQNDMTGSRSRQRLSRPRRQNNNNNNV